MEYRTLLDQRRKRLEKAASALDLLSDPDIKAQLAADPEMKAAFLAAIGAERSPWQPPVQLQPGRNVPPNGSQLKAVLDAAMKFSGDFTTKELVAKMQGGGYVFDADDPQIAVNSALKQLQARGFVALVTQGRGRAPSVFRYLQEEQQKGPLFAAPRTA